MRKHPVDTINLKIVSFYPFYHSKDNNGFVIDWESDIGFGQYTIYKTPEGFVADSNENIRLTRKYNNYIKSLV